MAFYNQHIKESDNYGDFANITPRKSPYLTQYADDFNRLQQLHKLQIEEWKRKRQLEEELWMKDKPKTYEYTGPYQEYNPPRDINKYFHDSKYEDYDDQQYQEEDESNDDTPPKCLPNKTNPFLTTTYEKTFISPRRIKGNNQTCGGMYLMRYHKDGHQNATLALKGLQTVINNSYRGCVMGMATERSIFIIEGEDDWGFSKTAKTNPRIGYRHRLGEKAISVLWFPDADQARGLYCCTHRNPFKESGFPTSEGFEAIYIPMIKSPLFKTLDTFLLIELIRAKTLYKEADLKAFQEDAQEEILKVAPYSSPMVSACLDGREAFKPGRLIRSGNQVYISRFNNQTEVASVWNSGKLQELRDKYNFNGPMTVVSFSIKDWSD